LYSPLLATLRYYNIAKAANGTLVSVLSNIGVVKILKNGL